MIILKLGFIEDYCLAQMETVILLWRRSPQKILVHSWIKLLNTIGNLFAKTTFEKGFTILTLVNSILLWVILKNNKQ